MTTVLPGENAGRYPDGNAVVVRGRVESVLIDAPLSVAANPPEGIDRVLVSHCHEDHIAGLPRFPDQPVHVHHADRPGLESLDGLMRIYGMPDDIDRRWRHEVIERFSYAPRPDALVFDDGDVFDVGGVTIHVVHLPGHTRGHCGFLIEPEGVMFLADVDLTGFGPYYGDAWSSLAAWERTLARCREIEAARYITFHQKGVVESRAQFLAMLDEYAAVIERRERALVAFLERPRTIDEMVAHRFVYRPHVDVLFADAVERRSAELHLERLLSSGEVHEVAQGRFLARGYNS